ncbi:MAG TPA: DEAD/DEAH box helicase [Stellaceae bacterium]|nr:DEAD/DEAH box helicase [Stellaceae bacterium]
MTTFDDLGLSEDLLRAVADTGYTAPTPIQAQAIPYVLMGRDVLGCAQTGTGKTASFTLPMIDILAGGRSKARMPRTLILEPTRELAAQVAQSFEVYGKYNKLSMALLIGGESFKDQESKLDRGVDVLIATPGRLIDLFERGKILMSDVKILVIDEADRMLDMGFIPDIERIVSLLPRIRQTLFFSATMPPEIRRLADAFLSNPKEISVAPPASPAITVTQNLSVLWEEDKRKALRELLNKEDVKNAIIFCNRKRDVDILVKSLQRHGFDALGLHGDMVQAKRTETLEKFRAGTIKLLVASDVAARGIDIQGLSHVFNFDVPIHAEDYVHRIGRTGRAGNQGQAFTFAMPAEGRAVAAIGKLIGKDIPVLTIEGFEHPELSFEDSGRGGRGRGRGRDRSDSNRRKPAKPAVEKAATAEETKPVREKPEKSSRNAKVSRPRERGPRQAPAAEPIQMGMVTPIETARRYRREDEDDPPVIGFGDHLPAFLSRPVAVGGRR